jgi:hypothetical protein
VHWMRWRPGPRRRRGSAPPSSREAAGTLSSSTCRRRAAPRGECVRCGCCPTAVVVDAGDARERYGRVPCPRARRLRSRGPHSSAQSGGPPAAPCPSPGAHVAYVREQRGRQVAGPSLVARRPAAALVALARGIAFTGAARRSKLVDPGRSSGGACRWSPSHRVAATLTSGRSGVRRRDRRPGRGPAARPPPPRGRSPPDRHRERVRLGALAGGAHHPRYAQVGAGRSTPPRSAGAFGCSTAPSSRGLLLGHGAGRCGLAVRGGDRGMTTAA